ncbi:MAG: fused MFS/spermidine synthase [Verrucomicrobiota bacterium]
MHLLFSLLSLLSAFLLFQVQPVISKFILPWFGGSPGVWTTCMLFFQIVLFGGYAYAHCLTRLRPKAQWLVHSVLLLTALVFLPIAPGDFWKPAGNEEPVGRILLLLLGTVGLPYFVLSSTSPLTQVWFTRAMPGKSPWRLYALSNLGSLAALLTYPFLIEPRWDVTQQTWVWSGGFVLFAGLSLWLARKTISLAPSAPAASPEVVVSGPEGLLVPAAETETVESPATPRWWQRLLWVLLPAAASALLLATSNHVSQDVAVVPFMWVIPLSLYLLTFIICFEHERWYGSWFWALLALGILFVTAVGKKLDVTAEPMPNYLFSLGWSFAAVFVACMVCHGELARLKPRTSHLTEFYLLMSLGGALGGLLVSMVAPQVFVTYLEWPLGLIVCFVVAWCAWVAWVWRSSFRRLAITLGALALAAGITHLSAAKYVQPLTDPQHWKSELAEILVSLDKAFYKWLATLPPTTHNQIISLEDAKEWLLYACLAVASLVLAALIYRQPKRALNFLVIVASFALGATGFHNLQKQTLTVDKRLERVRNFYGALNVDEDYDEGLSNSYRTLTHGGIIHGMQNLGTAYREEPVTYYGHKTGIGRALDTLAERPDARVAIVGMGAGTTACYAKAGQAWRFYEINPEIPRLATKYFTYLADGEKRGAEIDTVLGDARLMLEREPDQKFDVLLLDAFSGDAIPMHLLTKEAFAIYRRHMKPDGIIAVHVTNSYLALAPVVEKLAADIGWKTTRIITEEDGDHDSTDYVMVTVNEPFLTATPRDYPEAKEPDDVPLWTDRRHDLFQILMLD